MKALVAVATKGQSEAARVSAAEKLLDRGYGKPTQSHELAGPRGGPIPLADLSKLNDDQLATLEAIFGPLASAGSDDGGDQG